MARDDTRLARGAVRAPALLAAFALASVLPAGASAARAPQKPTTPPAPVAPVAIPPDLVALGQKMQALRLSSERFRLRFALSASGAHLPKEAQSFLKLFAIELSGEAGNSPPAAALKLTLLGHTVGVRVVGERSYVYAPTIARRDHRRPWIDFGRHGLDGLGGGPGGVDLSSGIGVTSFKRLLTALAGARSITELGAGIVDGQAISGYKATVAASALEEPAPIANAKPTGPFAPIGIGSAAKETPDSALLEVFIAPNGLPVQTRIREHEEGVTSTTLYDIYAVDFPLSVQPPPRRQTISIAALRALERKRSSRRARHAEGEER